MRNPASSTVPVPAPELADSVNGWSALFFPGTRVLALPSWRRARVMVPADTFVQRWRGSEYLPAFRPAARIYRMLLRARAASGIGRVRLAAESSTTCLTDLVEELLPGASVGAVMIGMPGAGRKVVARLTDSRGEVVGYLKCAGSELARHSLRHEYQLLKLLPPGAGPVPQRYATLDDVDALLIAPISGKMLRATLPPPRDLSAFACSLATTAHIELERHPWMRRVLHWHGPAVESSFGVLSRRKWPVAIQHGDLAPWNVFRTHDGRLTAVDWEYGRSAGFPGLDVAQYILQVACLCYRWSPRESRDYAIRCLSGDELLHLSVSEAAAMVTLGAYNVFQLAFAHGHAPGDPTQRWRQAVWEVTG
jgi:hypothetical protein